MLPRPTVVASLLTTMPALISAMIVINKPIPAVIANLRLLGILLTSASRNLKNESIINIIPSTRIAVSATSYE